MQKFHFIFFILLISVLSAHTFAQTAKPAVFTSAEGGFSIELAPPDSTETVAPVADTHSGGKRYSWDGDTKGYYDAGYLDLVAKVDPKGYLNRIAGGMIEQAKSGGGALKYRKDITLGDMAGVEFALIIKGEGHEAVFLNRIYAAKGRAYLLDAIWPVSQTGDAQTRVLDSFKLTTPVKTETAPVLAPVAAKPYVSEKGGFSINAPGKPDEETVNDAGPGGKRASGTLIWEPKDGIFLSVDYLDTGNLTKEERAAKLVTLVDRTAASMVERGNKLESKKSIALGDHPGIEVILRLKEGISILRCYMVNSRLFMLSTAWDDGEDGAAELKILDSFKILTPAPK
jgi:hypothetical protein